MRATSENGSCCNRSVIFHLGIFLFVSIALINCPNGYAIPIKGRNGGLPCAVCTALVALTEQLSVIHNETLVDAYSRLCSFLPVPKFRNACLALGEFYIPKIVKILINEVTADVVCHGVGICFTEKGLPSCKAFLPKGDFELLAARAKRQLVGELWKKSDLGPQFESQQPMFDPCILPGLKELCELFAKVFTYHKPLVDPDNDLFASLVEAYRGVSWRGKDCNDGNPMIHPGAKPIKGDIWFDSNCNGIKGVDPDSGQSYEDLLCSGLTN